MNRTAVRDLLATFELEPAGPGCFRATNMPSPHGVVFGGQLMGQALLAGRAGHDHMQVKTLHVVFARGAAPDSPLDIDVDPIHAGRTFASSTVTIRQGERICVGAQVLLTADEPDLIRHSEPPPPCSPPDSASDDDPETWQIRVVGDVDLTDPNAVGPAELDVWTRFVGAPENQAVHQALLAFASDGFLIGTAMRPHAGVGQAQAHKTLSTGVISHTITFHEPIEAGGWLLLSHRSGYAGRGRSYGSANVFSGSGQLVASFVQDAMVRPRDPQGGSKL
ncbi:MAG TPA: acyl-CoA thioesterase domain-containing protein [Acidimicrobiales bacterium]